jgi:hypothetical protein
MSKLLPCPFCGGKAAVRQDDGKFCVVCISDDIDCWCALGEQYDGCAMPNHSFYTEEIAVAKWNTRAAIPQGEPDAVRPEILRIIREAARKFHVFADEPDFREREKLRSETADDAADAILSALSRSAPSIPVSEPGVREALKLGLDAVMESFDHVETNDDLLLAQARHDAISAALESLS